MPHSPIRLLTAACLQLREASYSQGQIPACHGLDERDELLKAGQSSFSSRPVTPAVLGCRVVLAQHPAALLQGVFVQVPGTPAW